MPYDIISGVEPVYEDMPGWGELSVDEPLPTALERYVERIEQAVGVPVTLVSLGPDRAETVLRNANVVH
jgi:adenylosuccinate synthase